MACFCASRKKKFSKLQGVKDHVHLPDKEKNLNTWQTPSETTELRSTSFSVPAPFRTPGSSGYKAKVMNHDSPVAGDPCEVAYEGEDEHDETSPLEMDSEFILHACSGNEEKGRKWNVQGTKSLDRNAGKFNSQENPNEEERPTLGQVNSFCSLNIDDDIEASLEMNASDPGIVEARFWASPKLKRSCSNLAITSELEASPFKR